MLYLSCDGVITDGNGLIYMRACYYSPDMRRFVNVDVIHGEISDSSSLNPALNNSKVNIITTMRLIMKKAVYIIFMILILAPIISCGYCPQNSLEKTEYYDAYAIMNASVPLYYNSKLIDSPREQYDTVYLVEIDSYGRRLYKYQSGGQFCYSLETWIISQKTEDGIVYFDRDACWVSVNSSDENFSGIASEKIQTLKQNNLWDQPLDESDWSSTAYGADLYAQHTKELQDNPEKYAALCQAVHHYLNLEERYVIRNSNVLLLNDGNTLLTIVGKLDTQAYEFDLPPNMEESTYFVGQYVAYYLVLYHSTDDVIVCEELNDIYDCNDIVAKYMKLH